MLTQRLGSITQKDPAFIDSLIEQITAHPGCCDEVWLATDYGFPSLEEHARTAAILRETAEKFRRIGIRVSLQLSNSIGHGQYMASRDCSGLVYDGSPVEHMVDADGTVADYCFCWRGKNFRKYVMEEIRLYADAVKPHTLWVDDDLRATNHAPVSRGCFCDDCVKAFGEKYGVSMTREEMVQHITGHYSVWRQRHIEFLRESLYDFTYEMGAVLHRYSPDSAMGYQYCANGGYTGFGYDFIFGAMKDATGKIPASRPGGGAYDDHDPVEFVDKAELIGYQNYMLPEYVKDRRPEIESLPDIVYGKSIGGTCFETSYYLASGNNAMSYAILMNDYEPMEWHGEMLGAFAKHRPYWKKLCELNDRTHPDGIKPAMTHVGYLAEGFGTDFEYSNESFRFGLPYRYFGVPVAMTRRDCGVYLLNWHNAARMSEEEVNDLLTKPVLTDGAAVEVLTRRGFDVGADARPIDTSILGERYAEHPVNEGFAGRKWNGGWGHNSDWEVLGDNLEILARYVPTNGTKLDREYIADAVFTTPAGAKWAVSYDMWRRGISSEKRRQLLNMMAYISGKAFAAELLTPIQAMVHPRVDEDGRLAAVSVTNVTVGDSGELKMILRNPAGTKFTYMSQYSDEISLDGEDLGGGEYLVKIPDLHGWSVGTVFCG